MSLNLGSGSKVSLEEFFCQSKNDIKSLIQEPLKLKILAFYGDGLIRYYIMNKCWKRYHLGLTPEALFLYFKRYETNESMTFFLNEYTDVAEYLEGIVFNEHSYGTLFEALIWNASKLSPNDRISYHACEEILDFYFNFLDLNLPPDKKFFEATKSNLLLESAKPQNHPPFPLENIFSLYSYPVSQAVSKIGIGHDWDSSKSRANTVFCYPSIRTWEGMQCQLCRAFLLQRKCSRKSTFLYLLGLHSCPGSTLIWLPQFEDFIKLHITYLQEKTKIKREELKSWGFLDSTSNLIYEKTTNN